MSQIPLNHSGAAGSSALSGLGGPSAGTRKDSGRAVALPATAPNASAPSFSQLLNQSASHLKAQAPQTPFASTSLPGPSMASPQTPNVATASSNAAQAAQRAAQNRAANGAGHGNGNGTSGTAQEENKLNARNALNRNAANKQADAPKTPAPSAQAKADAADAAARPVGARNTATDNSQSSQAGGKTDGTEATAGQDDQDAKDTPAAGDPTAAAQQMLAMLRGDAPAEARPQGKADGLVDGTGEDHAAVAGHGKGGHAHAGGAAGHDALQQELQQATAADADGKKPADEALEGLQALAGGSKEIALGDHAAAGGPGHSFEALLAAAQQADGTGAAGATDAPRAADAPSVPLSQPLDSPDFAPELSASVSLLIQDGVHEAQLQLNPADMGPVAIQIQLDGQQAQVNFHAAQAETRDVLMRSMPDLAAALQNQGITLSGGGVFAQTQSGNGQDGRGSDRDGDGRRGGLGGKGGDDGLTSVARSERRTAPRGLVDLYA
ncbi:flagellar hook-length control protein FliK [Roseateles terrae]|uniref:Flagellar hook-length control protein FliK n=1 Tax=Roseateles terrae TaxID=431060 RepID=A0ABR6GWM3_9BURK|nr:flagellar hook-length control protein FliK [Roseateles terrae]MBB3196517.1 flagellar hook-length control protein FliK [Roseateles terrae]OWQ83013.1 hypothetical protein CDN98_23615 [Roseateles terrae]